MIAVYCAGAEREREDTRRWTKGEEVAKESENLLEQRAAF